MKENKIETALISVYHKENLEPIIKLLRDLGVSIYSTGGTLGYIEQLGVPVEAVEDLTGYPAILGGRVKTLHPKVFGGILQRSAIPQDQEEIATYEIPPIDLVIVDLYPFEETVASGGSEQDIIEKIDIGGISLIRAAAKNFNDVLIVSSRSQYRDLEQLLVDGQGVVDFATRRRFAAQAFGVSSHYDTAIFSYFNQEEQVPLFRHSENTSEVLRYGENPHQAGTFFGNFEEIFEQLNGKPLSYNNLVDVDAAVSLIGEFEGEMAFAIIKHTNACGVATGQNLKETYLKALASDPISAFGGILIANHFVDLAAAEEINQLFFEVLIAPGFDDDALEVLKSKKNRIILKQKMASKNSVEFKSLLNGVLVQDRDLKSDQRGDFKVVTKKNPTTSEMEALEFAGKIVKHTKSNAIVLTSSDQLLGSGVGQTSRVDALKQAIAKAENLGHSLEGAVMASDAFFPFPDCVEIALGAGVKAVIQPGGSVKDQLSIDYCDANDMSMVFTGVRHFKH